MLFHFVSLPDEVFNQLKDLETFTRFRRERSFFSQIQRKDRKDQLKVDLVLFVDDNRIKYLQLTDKPHHHPPVFDGTDKTVPTDLQDKSVVDEIEEVNEGKVRCKLI